jgi:hypothetical protein
MMNEKSIIWLILVALEDHGKQYTSDPYNSIEIRRQQEIPKFLQYDDAFTLQCMEKTYLP